VIVESLEELAQARIQECAPRAVADFKTSVRPIYGLLDGRRLTHIGSCLLLDIDGKRVVSTAAHIADDLAVTPLFIGGLVGTHPVQLAAMRGRTARRRIPNPQVLVDVRRSNTVLPRAVCSTTLRSQSPS
jgi:hypothetical protein